MTFDVISGPEGEEIRHEESRKLIFQRGDIQGDGDVDMIDAFFGIQYLVGSRSVEDIRSLNMASVRHDNGGDVMDFIDCIYIAQYVMGIRDCYFELVSVPECP